LTEIDLNLPIPRGLALGWLIHWTGEITKTDPDKGEDLSWFSLNDLPKIIIPSIRQALEASKSGVIYTEFGWDT
jgi:hypothetical protein